MYDAGSFQPSGSTCRALRSLERQANFVGWDIAQDFEEIARVKTIIELVPGVANRKLVLGFPEVGCLTLNFNMPELKESRIRCV